MYNEKQKTEMQKQLDDLRKCSGDCLHCNQLSMHFAEVGRCIYYVAECGKCPNFSGSETLKNLKTDCIDFLEFE